MSVALIYLVSMPGRDLDGEPTEVVADDESSALERAERRAAAWHCTLTLVGRREGSRFVPVLSYDQLPWWAQEMVDNQAEARARSAHRARRSA